MKVQTVACVLSALSFSTVANAIVHNVLDFGAIPNDTTDDAPAFRSAVAAAAADGGGIVAVPAGIYRFESASSVDSTACVVINYPSIQIQGEASAETIGDPKNSCGSTIHGMPSVEGKSLFKVASHNNGGSGPHNGSGFVIENINLARDRGLGSGPIAAGSYGIALGYTGTISTTVGGTLSRITIRNVSSGGQSIGIGVDYSSPAQPIDIRDFSIQTCSISDNWRYGLYIEDFSNLWISDCRIDNNGGRTSTDHYDGIKISPRKTTTRFATISNCLVQYSGGAGIAVVGALESGDLNLSITGCDCKNNDYQGAAVITANSTRISNSVFQGNGVADTGAAGLYLYNSKNVSLTGTSFVENRFSGLVVSNTTGVTASACAFRKNNAGNIATVYAMVVSQGQSHAYSSLAFDRDGGNQYNGVLFQFDPVGVVANTLTFTGAMTNYVGVYGNTAAAEFSVDYFDGTTQQHIED